MSLELERRGPAAWLWLNRPEVRNALDDALVVSIESHLSGLEKDRSVRVLVLAGRGPAFCAGGDLARMQKAGEMTRAASRRDAGRFAALLHRIHGYPKPVIARVHGPAFAGGMGLVAACDLALAAEEAEFALPETRIGLVPAMIGPYLVRAMGERQARRYVLTGERLAARDALRLGLVHDCVPAAQLDEAVERLCAGLARAAPGALATSKKLLARVAGAPLSAKLARQTAALLAEVRSGKEAREGIAAFLEKRKPCW